MDEFEPSVMESARGFMALSGQAWQKKTFLEGKGKGREKTRSPSALKIVLI
jgi:hypothetical protein